MPIIENPKNFDYGHVFIMRGKNILVKKGSSAQASTAKPLGKEDLPDQQTATKCLSAQIVSDWYAEAELDYCALMLEDGSPTPSALEEIPLRQFFWQSKSEEEQKNAVTSKVSSLAARAHGFLCLRQTYRYCPKCGSLLTVHSTQVAKVCPSCGRIDFPRIEPAIIVLVSKGDQILLAKSKTVVSGFYSCIAGFMEHGESAEQCVEREVMEETGLKIKNITYKGSQPWPFPDQLMLAFTAEYESGQIKIQESEIEDAGWYSRDNLPPIPQPGSVAYNLIMGIFGNK